MACFLTLLPQRYSRASVILLCYDIQRYGSFARLHSKWLPEVAQHTAGVPIILVGLKEDKRGDQESIAEVDIADGDQVR